MKTLKSVLTDHILNIAASFKGDKPTIGMCMEIFSHGNPLEVPTDDLSTAKLFGRHMEYSAVDRPILFAGPVWESSYTMMYPTILADNFGDFTINSYNLRDIVDTLIEIRKELRAKQAIALVDGRQDAGFYGIAQLFAKGIINCLYGKISRLIDQDKFAELAIGKFNYAAKTIVENGGLLIFASVDTFIYTSELPITFDVSQHNDKFRSVVGINHGFIADPSRTVRVHKVGNQLAKSLYEKQADKFLK